MEKKPLTSAKRGLISNKVSSYHNGLLAEDKAVLYLKNSGAKILAQRWREGLGEIDIVAVIENIITIVEVKYRNTYAAALTAISNKQRKRLEASAEIAWQKWGAGKSGLRFDLIAILPDGSLHHHEDWWRIEN